MMFLLKKYKFVFFAIISVALLFYTKMVLRDKYSTQKHISGSCRDSVLKYAPNAIRNSNDAIGFNAAEDWNFTVYSLVMKDAFPYFGQFYQFDIGDTVAAKNDLIMRNRLIAKRRFIDERTRLMMFLVNDCHAIDWLSGIDLTKNGTALLTLPSEILCKRWNQLKLGVSVNESLWHGCVVSEHPKEIFQFAVNNSKSRWMDRNSNSDILSHAVWMSIFSSSKLNDSERDSIYAYAKKNHFWNDLWLKSFLKDKNEYCLLLLDVKHYIDDSAFDAIAFHHKFSKIQEAADDTELGKIIGYCWQVNAKRGKYADAALMHQLSDLFSTKDSSNIRFTSQYPAIIERCYGDIGSDAEFRMKIRSRLSAKARSNLDSFVERYIAFKTKIHAGDYKNAFNECDSRAM